MRFFTTGDWSASAPPEIQALPLNLLKTTAYPAQTEVAQLGIEQYRDGYDPVIVPQRMGFTKWKDPGYPRGFGQNVAGLLQATRHQMAVQRAASVKVASLPTADFVEAAQRKGLTRIPPRVFDQNLRAGYFPLALSVIPMDQVVDAPALNRMAQELSDPPEINRGVASRSAQQSVANTQAALATITGNASLLPWFMKG